MEEKKVLLIGDPDSFMVNAITKDLYDIGYNVTRVSHRARDVKGVNFRPDLYIVYLDNSNDFSETLMYLDAEVLASDIKVVIIGEKMQVDRAYDFIPEERVEGSFIRPVNIKQLEVKLQIIMENERVYDGAKRILVIDDDGMMLKAIKSWLEIKYRVTIVNSGMSAIKFLATNSVDLILLDYEMPITDGPEVYQMLKSDPDTADIPIMFLTVKSDKESVMRVLALKPVNYLLKTMPPKMLVAEIDSYFETHP
ncbi:MAG: response regulator [Lachnospiraceae bacterium]|nr:response regulator [Lachnospiraceae bacterium]